MTHQTLSPPSKTERRVVALATLLQFISIVDFMMVLPLGPDFARDLHIDASDIGLIGGSYTLAAAIAGLVGATFYDKFDRRPALLIAVFGLSLSSLSAIFATNTSMLIGARILAGIFGSAAYAIVLATVIDVVPEQRRGKAMAKVLGAFSAASVIGVPIGLELARLGGWRLPFILIASCGLAVGLLTLRILPSMKGHMERLENRRHPWKLLTQSNHLLAYGMIAAAIFSSFLIIPHISSYFQFNLGYPRENIGLLYLVGGLISYFTLQIAGRITDRHGSLPVSSITALAMCCVFFFGFANTPEVPLMLIFVAFMVFSSARTVAANALSSKVAIPEERAAHMALQTAVQNLAAGIAAITSAALLGENTDGSLNNVPLIAWLAMLFACLQPLITFTLQRRLSSGVSEKN